MTNPLLCVEQTIEQTIEQTEAEERKKGRESMGIRPKASLLLLRDASLSYG